MGRGLDGRGRRSPSWWPPVLSAWLRFGRDLMQTHELLAAPLQALRKLPIYARYLWRRQTAWVRAKREGD